MACGPKAKVSAMYVDMEKVAAVKAAVKKTGEVPFVSTNDVLTSAFGKAAESRIMMFAINWRGRLEGVGTNLAGNYEGGLIFDPASLESPANIRKTLNQKCPMLRVPMTMPLPGVCEAMRMKLSLYTSWAFPLDFKLPGCDNLEYDLHVPLEADAPIDMCIVFWAKPGRLACLYMCPRLTEDMIRNGDGCVMGENLPGMLAE
jgi:hypothetical protein